MPPAHSPQRLESGGVGTVGRPGFKHRAWQAFVSVSASGPEFTPTLEQRGVTPLPRLAANLRYTTADADYFSKHWQAPWPDSGHEELHVPHLQNPSRSALIAAFFEARAWLCSRARRDDWDGGHITFCFAGHGRDRDGALVLEDGTLTAGELCAILTQTALDWSEERRLRVAVILDACHSGAFLLDFLAKALQQPRIRIEYLAAACLSDEAAWEEAGLGHGVFTYCWSIRPRAGGPPFGGLAATGVQPDNSFGPALAVAQGPFGCSVLTYGRQNPLVFRDDELLGCGIGIPVDPTVPARQETWLSEISRARDELRTSIGRFHPSIRIGRWLSTDAEARDAIHELLETGLGRVATDPSG
jgi:hypothetical protein